MTAFPTRLKGCSGSFGSGQRSSNLVIAAVWLGKNIKNGAVALARLIAKGFNKLCDFISDKIIEAQKKRAEAKKSREEAESSEESVPGEAASESAPEPDAPEAEPESEEPEEETEQEAGENE